MLRGFLVITGALAVADGILRRTLSPIPPGTLSPIPPSRRRSLRVPRMDEDSDSLLSTLPGPVSSSAMDEATAEDLLTLPGLGSAAGQPRGDIPARRLAGSGGPTVWSEFGELAAETGAVNLGQGFPDWAPPDFVVAEGVRALREGYHQYTRPAGHPPLAEVLAKRYSTHLRRRVDATSEVAVTVGASQALYLTLQALVNPGDEVVLLEPAFDLYYGQVRLAGGVAVGVPLSIDEGEWRLDIDALARVLTPRSKVLVLNSPHNPTGKAFTLEEMRAIADLVRRTPQLLVISDEVYKYTVYDGVHEHFAAVRHLPCPCPHGVHFLRTEPPPERRDSAAGDVRPHGDALIGREDVLGDRVAGGVVHRAVAARAPHSAAAPLCAVLRGDARAAGVLPACARPPVVPGSHPRLCQALSRVLAAADEPYEGHACYYDHLCELYRHKREILATGLRRCGMQPLRGNGGFFLMAETSRLTVPEEYLRQTTAAAPEMTRDWCALPRHRPARFGPFRRRRRHLSPSPRQGVVPMARVRGGRDRDSMRTVLLVCAQASCREPRALRLLQERRNAH